MYSVIIPAKNEEKNIERCIRSIYGSINNGVVEVIVVDNGSRDKTVAVAKSNGAKVLVDEKANVSGLRNLGAVNSSYPILAFIDADCEAIPGWLDNGASVLRDVSIGVTGEFPLVPEKKASWIEKTLYGTPAQKSRVVNYIGSCNMLMRREVFELVGGFNDQALTGEDTIFCHEVRSLGLKIVADPRVSVIHYGFPKNLKQLFRRELWHGMGMIDLFKQGRLTLPLIWAFINLGLVGALMLFVCFGMRIACIAVLVCFALLPMGASLLRMYRMQLRGNFFKLYVIFWVYGVARTVSLSRIILKV